LISIDAVNGCELHPNEIVFQVGKGKMDEMSVYDCSLEQLKPSQMVRGIPMFKKYVC
jgi:hypothetical protein